jgi:rhamnose transport system permease protein
MHEVVLVLLLAGLMAAAGAVMPNFVNLESQLFLSRHLWETAILALGMTLIIITAGIDLSVGSAMGMCAVALGMCFHHTGSVALSCVACLAVGGAGGMLNGALIAWLKVHPLIVTLATYAAFRGIAEGASQGAVYSRFGENFESLARGMWLGVPIAAYIFGVLAIVFAIFLAKTPTGRFLYAIGHNETAARFSGIAVDRIKFWLYTTSGLLAGLATLIYVSRFNTAKADAGAGLELDVITAVVVGGTSIFGGRGNIAGTVLGLLLIHETKLFVGRYWRADELKGLVVGVLLILSVLVYRALSPKGRS